MIDAWWRSLKHHWLFLRALDSVATARRLVAFYVDEHNRTLPHSALRGQAHDEMYFGMGDTIPAELTPRRRHAPSTPVNRSASCATCLSLDGGVSSRETAHDSGFVPSKRSGWRPRRDYSPLPGWRDLAQESAECPCMQRGRAGRCPCTQSRD